MKEYWKSEYTGEIYEVEPDTIKPEFMVGWYRVTKVEYDQQRKEWGF